MTRLIVFLFHLLSSIIALLIVLFFTIGFSASADDIFVSSFLLNLGLNPNPITLGIIGFIIGVFIDVILFGTLFVSLETNQNIRKMLSKISNIEKKVNQIENNSRSDPSI